eukprot:TRINITY_DN8221_c0_g1_i10.p7 TRINITY_DN8221_c0_g1~~TRINITY_DN8221_c0_g1_i10.p7  ORF type:complete len:198 (-),score=-9.44 TRINITY_DN8221_c0_g1_i10:159-752(-)
MAVYTDCARSVVIFKTYLMLLFYRLSVISQTTMSFGQHVCVRAQLIFSVGGLINQTVQQNFLGGGDRNINVIYNFKIQYFKMNMFNVCSYLDSQQIMLKPPLAPLVYARVCARTQYQIFYVNSCVLGFWSLARLLFLDIKTILTNRFCLLLIYFIQCQQRSSFNVSISIHYCSRLFKFGCLCNLQYFFNVYMGIDVI